MIQWETRSVEERNLLNPAFCANLLWHAALARTSKNLEPLPLEEAFLILPFVLPEVTREALPASLKTSLPVWLENNPVERQRLSVRCKALVPYTRAGLIFGGTHDFIRFEGRRLIASAGWKKKVKLALGKSSAEVRSCATKAEFVSRWFANIGSSSTAYALIGIRP